jgi:dTDP-4-amino-4,6-dideoxygalactose transaminase
MSPPGDRIPFLAPELPPLEDVARDLAAIYASGVFSNGGPFERRLADRLTEYLGATACVPVANGTLGLMLAARALARPDAPRRVLLPSFTFPASALAMEWAGLEPVFCDVDPESWQPTLDPDLLRRHADELALVLLCNTFGAPSDAAFWREAAEGCGLPILVDSASGLGGRYTDGRRLGGAGLVEVFSMHATKTFGVGEGGVVAVPDAALAARLARLRNFGLDGPPRGGREASPECVDDGLNAKLPEVLAAIACRALDRHEDVLAARRRVADAYRARLEPHGFRFQKHGDLSPWQCVSVCVPAGVDRDALRARLFERGIETRRYFAPPLHRQARWAGRRVLGELDTTETVARRILSLPTGNALSEARVDRVCREILGRGDGA